MKLTCLPLLACLFTACSCGASPGPGPVTPPVTSVTPPVPSTPPVTAEGLESVPLPALPSAEPEAAAPRPEPTITDVESAKTALSQGFYAAVARALPTLRGHADASELRLLEARLDFATGRYDEVAALAAAAPASATGLRTLAAEALLARGRLDDAEHALSALARVPEARRARLLLGQLLTRRGRDSEARPFLMSLIEEYNDQRVDPHDAEGLSYVGRAAALLGSPQDANDAFRESTAADAHRVETQLEWAKLFLDHYDAGHAEDGVRLALADNPEDPEALTLMARIRLDQSLDFVTATTLIARALATNPKLVAAWLIRAEIAVRDMDLAAATDAVDHALGIDPSSGEAIALRGAIRYLADDHAGYDAARRAALALDAGDARFFVRVGELADWEHRYPFEVQLAREAVRVDPEDASGWALLGNNLLRTGDEDEGLRALHQAWDRDHFNVRVYNTLNLYDDVIGPHYQSFTHGPFWFRMQEEERPLLERYVPQLLEQAYRSMVQRYHFTPEGAVRIELYARDGDFSVRTAGLPNVGVQGVCFGKVVTALSPQAGPFNWGQITWHELSHVFHIQLSHNRVPRWFTEGLAEYETLLAGKGWRREQDAMLYRVLASGELPRLSDMNHAFTHARSGEAMTAAYYASSQIVKYMGERFGFDALVAMLRLWGEGKSTAQVFDQALHQSVDAVDTAFRADATARLARRSTDFGVDFSRFADLDAFVLSAAQAPQDARKQAEHAAALMAHGDLEGAVTRAQAALALEAGQPTALFVLARAALAQQDAAKAKTRLDALLAAHHDGYDVRLMAARTALALEDRPGAKAHLEVALALDPERPEALMGLLEFAREDHDDDARREILMRIANLDEHSREVSAELLDLLLAQQRWPDLLRFGEAARYVDPARAESHRELAEAYLHLERPADALYELDSALLAHPTSVADIQHARARALTALGRRSDAQAAQAAANAAPAAPTPAPGNMAPVSPTAPTP